MVALDERVREISGEVVEEHRRREQQTPDSLGTDPEAKKLRKEIEKTTVKGIIRCADGGRYERP